MLVAREKIWQDWINKIAQDADILTMWFTPSWNWTLHIGHYLTLFGLFKTLENTRSAIAILLIDDREFSFQNVPKLPEEQTVKATLLSMRHFIDKANTQLSTWITDRVKIIRISELFLTQWLNEKYFWIDFINMLVDNRRIIWSAYSKMNLWWINWIRPNCPSCNEWFVKKPRWKRYKYENPIIYSCCTNTQCSTSEFTIDLHEWNTNWSIYYALVSLLSIMISKKDNYSVIKFLWWDYSLPWWHWDISKAERANLIIEHSNANVKVVTGHLVNIYWRKVSKSKWNYSQWEIDFHFLEELLSIKEKVIDLWAR